MARFGWSETVDLANQVAATLVPQELSDGLSVLRKVILEQRRL
jgi:hypothetical protein